MNLSDEAIAALARATYFDSLTTYRALPKTVIWIPNLIACKQPELGSPT